MSARSAHPKPIEKIIQAARDFEAVLIESWLEPMEKTFSTLPGKDDLSGADNYHYLGTQALSAALAQSGGIGLAAMMARNLLKANGWALMLRRRLPIEVSIRVSSQRWPEVPIKAF